MELTEGFVQLLEGFRPVFQLQTFPIFVELMTGWVLSHRRRFVTDLIVSSGSVGKRHFSDYHRFFSQYVWELDLVSKTLFLLLVRVFAASGIIELTADDTLARKRGLMLYGTGMHHDPLMSSKAKTITSWGHDWVVLCLVIRHPFWAPTKVFSLPVCFRLYRNRQGVTKGKKKRKQKKTRRDRNHRTRPELCVEMLQLVASWVPDRQLLVTGDSAYGGGSVLQKLPGMQAWADDTTRWQTLSFDEYGFHATVKVKTIKALYYKAGKDRLLTIVLVRDVLAKRPDQMFYCTRLDWNARQILHAYAARWSIEVTFHDSKQLLGFEDPANRTEQAVRRTAPMAMVLYSLIAVWFEREGHRHLKFPERPWYPAKEEPSFADMLTTLRCQSWKTYYRDIVPKRGLLKKAFDQITWFLSLAG